MIKPLKRLLLPKILKVKTHNSVQIINKIKMPPNKSYSKINNNNNSHHHHNNNNKMTNKKQIIGIMHKIQRNKVKNTNNLQSIKKINNKN